MQVKNCGGNDGGDWDKKHLRLNGAHASGEIISPPPGGGRLDRDGPTVSGHNYPEFGDGDAPYFDGDAQYFDGSAQYANGDDKYFDGSPQYADGDDKYFDGNA